MSRPRLGPPYASLIGLGSLLAAATLVATALARPDAQSSRLAQPAIGARNKQVLSVDGLRFRT